ncbi:S-layer homology domain-containing protein [Lysinibacillus fusiformis]|uniref:S-layer homology domain-containing protein n=1 Tax=Lysinibacillus fusiformis TaxID=28031 RepID=UPI001E53C2C5|nr:S-layer homology domain-containing protein [Lysinibacillus fusiformis]MCE4043449.1 S-layer homology domain-containing protein [Lysinibacillus fusiformis]
MKKITILSFLFLLSLFAIFANSASAESVFKDVEETNPNYNDLKFLYDKDLLSDSIVGKKQTFGKDSKATRGDAVTMIGKTMGYKMYTTYTPYKDVDYDEVFSGHVLELSKLGIINGYSDGTFKSDGSLTRGQLALFIDRAFGKYLPEGNQEFSDVPKSNDAYKSVKKLVGAGITTGYGNGTFKPNEPLTKMHLHVFMARLVKYLEEQNIKVPLNDPLIESTERYKPINDAKIKLGLSKSEVYELIKHRMTNKQTDRWYSTNVGRNGLDGKTTYGFFDGKLESITNIYNWKSQVKASNSIRNIHEIYLEEYKKEFGENYKTNIEDDLIMTFWDKSTFTIKLNTHILDGKIDVVSHISTDPIPF